MTDPKRPGSINLDLATVAAALSEAEQVAKECLLCDGCGWQEVDCPECGGKGLILQHYHCDVCNGEGVHGVLCDHKQPWPRECPDHGLERDISGGCPGCEAEAEAVAEARDEIGPERYLS